MLVLSEKIPYSRPALGGAFLVLLVLAAVGVRPESQITAETSPNEAPQVAPDASEPFERIDREAIVGLEITKSRSFLYAPPPMPHDKVDVGQNDCMGCHAPVNDIRKKWRAIRPLSHEVHSQCLQCHVAQERDLETLFAESEFVGLDFPGSGSRAHDFAPPTVPHKIFMRENCLSCHGDTGYAEIKTSHPERSQCVQCHVAEADMDYTRAMP